MTATFLRRLIFSIFWNAGIFGAVLFATAGTFDWWRAWVLVAVIAVATVATMLGVLRTRPELLNERFKGIIQKGQPPIDRLLVLLFVFSYGLAIAFIPLDVFELHILPKPPVWLSSLGLILVAAGWCIIALVFRENAFAAPAVKHQKEREHHVVDTGVYAVVRHPMYSGIMLFNLGIALWLESYAGALMTFFPIAFLVVRILFEERFLRRELIGYEAYAHKVPNRLIPFVW
jgi:protein-S-isoprenylcysteine O-methyltransferase Ste14